MFFSMENKSWGETCFYKASHASFLRREKVSLVHQIAKLLPMFLKSVGRSRHIQTLFLCVGRYLKEKKNHSIAAVCCKVSPVAIARETPLQAILFSSLCGCCRSSLAGTVCPLDGCRYSLLTAAIAVASWSGGEVIFPLSVHTLVDFMPLNFKCPHTY